MFCCSQRRLAASMQYALAVATSGEKTPSADTGIGRSFGPRVRRAREEQGMTQRQLAEILERDHRIKLDSSAITRIERSALDPDSAKPSPLQRYWTFP